MDALLCLESVLMDLVYWLRLHNFDGQCSRESETSASPPQGCSPAPSHLRPLALGFILRGTTLDFLTGTWTREGRTVLLEKTEHSASGNPEEAANMSLGINCVLGLEL